MKYRMLFMLCNNCARLGARDRIWIVDHRRCACIFILQE